MDVKDKERFNRAMDKMNEVALKKGYLFIEHQNVIFNLIDLIEHIPFDKLSFNEVMRLEVFKELVKEMDDEFKPQKFESRDDLTDDEILKMDQVNEKDTKVMRIEPIFKLLEDVDIFKKGYIVDFNKETPPEFTEWPTMGRWLLQYKDETIAAELINEPY